MSRTSVSNPFSSHPRKLPEVLPNVIKSPRKFSNSRRNEGENSERNGIPVNKFNGSNTALRDTAVLLLSFRAKLYSQTIGYPNQTLPVPVRIDKSRLSKVLLRRFEMDLEDINAMNSKRTSGRTRVSNIVYEICRNYFIVKIWNDNNYAWLYVTFMIIRLLVIIPTSLLLFARYYFDANKRSRRFGWERETSVV